MTKFFTIFPRLNFNQILLTPPIFLNNVTHTKSKIPSPSFIKRNENGTFISLYYKQGNFDRYSKTIKILGNIRKISKT